MEIIPIHYKASKPVQEWSEIKDQAKALIQYLKASQGQFKGNHKRAIGLSHCQVEEKEPFAFFVVDEASLKPVGFKHQVIINARVVEAPEKQLVRDLEGDRMVSNIYRPNEGCMSFPFRDVKHVERYHTITVEYEIPSGIWPFTKFKTIREECGGLKAQVFQHEIDHAKGKNIYFSEPPINQ